MLESSTPLAAHQSAEWQAARQRLDRLDGFLKMDPGNLALRVDAFETALRCSAWAQAQAYLNAPTQDADEALAWALREGDFWLAQRRYQEARQVLQRLASQPDTPAGFAEVVLHNLAYIDFSERLFADCIQRLAPVMQQRVNASESHAAPSGESHATPLRLNDALTPALQQLWLRALHHQGELEQACDWAQAAERAGHLDVRAAGVVSLIALDESRVDLAQRWSLMALSMQQEGDRPIEALVTQASLALAAQDAARARQFTDAALSINPQDGRAWSARAFADLLAGDLPAAEASFQRSVKTFAEHIGTWHGLGWTQLLMNQHAAAQATFEHALALDRNFAESHGGLAVVLAARGQTQAAHEAVERALRLDKNNLSGQYAQALLSGEASNAQAVQRLAKRLLGKRAGPLGGTMADWMGQDASSANSDE